MLQSCAHHLLLILSFSCHFRIIRTSPAQVCGQEMWVDCDNHCASAEATRSQQQKLKLLPCSTFILDCCISDPKMPALLNLPQLHSLIAEQYYLRGNCATNSYLAISNIGTFLADPLSFQLVSILIF